MLLLDALNPNSIMRMDLEYGKVVDEWKVSDVVPVKNILPECVRGSLLVHNSSYSARSTHRWILNRLSLVTVSSSEPQELTQSAQWPIPD